MRICIFFEPFLQKMPNLFATPFSHKKTGFMFQPPGDFLLQDPPLALVSRLATRVTEHLVTDIDAAEAGNRKTDIQPLPTRILPATHSETVDTCPSCVTLVIRRCQIIDHGGSSNFHEVHHTGRFLFPHDKPPESSLKKVQLDDVQDLR